VDRSRSCEIAHDLNQTRRPYINLKIDRKMRDWHQSQP